MDHIARSFSRSGMISRAQGFHPCRLRGEEFEVTTITLICLRGSRSGDRFDVADGEAGHPTTPILLGRAPESVVPLHPVDDSLASIRHAELRLEGGEVVVTDLDSTNGTWVGPATALRKIHKAERIQSGTTIALGKDGPLFRVLIAGAHSLPGPLPATALEPRRRNVPIVWFAATLSVLVVGAGTGFGFYWHDQATTNEQLATELLATRTELADQVTRLDGALRAAAGALEKARGRLASAEDGLVAARESLRTTSNRLGAVETAVETTKGDAWKLMTAQGVELERIRQVHEAQVGKTDAALAKLRAKEHVAEAIVKDFELGLFMLIAIQKDGSLEGFCTAFAVDPEGILATNSHCLEVVDQATDEGLRVVARMNRRPDRSFSVSRWKRHADYDGSAFSNDVGLIRLDLRGATLPVIVPMAPWIDLIALTGGQAIYTMGFPGKVMNPDAPSADMRAAVISRITDFSNAPGMPGDNRMVWHSALTTKGTSGSPIFNASGQLVAINNGVLSARRVMVPGDHGGMKEDIAYDANGLNFGIRADALTELIAAGLP